MIIHREEFRVEDAYITGARTEDELWREIHKLTGEGFSYIGDHKIDYGSHIEYNAKMQRYIKRIKDED